MNEILKGILLLLAGSGVFMTGMKLMSDGLEQSAGPGIRKMFNKISNKRFVGVGIGAGVTAIIQSSAATTVMVIGFVNAGIMTLFQATAIIMGANIGTTITGVIVSLSTSGIKLYAMALSLIGIIMAMFFKNDTVKKIGTVLSGLGLIFVGLDLMGGALDVEAIKNAFSNLFTKINFPLLLILVGMVFTALIQSSSAATGLIITLAAAGGISVESSLFLVLGTNIGTCITAILASAGASANAKRAALIHLIFNVIGTLIFTIILLIFKKYIIQLIAFFAPESFGMQIAYFHVLFNVVTTLLLVGFIKQLTWIAEKLIKMKDDDADAMRLYYIDERILQTPSIAVAQILKEVMNLADIARQNLDRAFKALIELDVSEKDKIRKEEQRINFINKNVSKYLVQMTSLSLPVSDDRLLGTLHHVISDIERIGDHAENLLEEAERMIESGVKFSALAIEELNEMYSKINEMFTRSVKIFETRDVKLLKVINDLECEVDEMKKLLEFKHIARLNKGECTVESGTHFYAVITGLERVADHLTNISYSIKSPSGMSLSVAKKMIKADAKNKAEAMSEFATRKPVKKSAKSKIGAKPVNTDKNISSTPKTTEKEAVKTTEKDKADTIEKETAKTAEKEVKAEVKTAEKDIKTAEKAESKS